jgi:hypothetical protein
MQTGRVGEGASVYIVYSAGDTGGGGSAARLAAKASPHIPYTLSDSECSWRQYL